MQLYKSVFMRALSKMKKGNAPESIMTSGLEQSILGAFISDSPITFS